MSIRRVSMSAVLIAACLSVSGCTVSTTTAPAAARFVEGDGEPQTSNPLAQDDPAIAAFGVVKFDELPNVSSVGAVRMFGTGGGDPAMNGLNVYLAFVAVHDERGFLLGNFRDYRVIATSPGRIDLEYDEDFMDDAGEIKNRTLRAIVSWTETEHEPSPNPEFPATVTMTPAR